MGFIGFNSGFGDLHFFNENCQILAIYMFYCSSPLLYVAYQSTDKEGVGGTGKAKEGRVFFTVSAVIACQTVLARVLFKSAVWVGGFYSQ